MIAPNRAGGKLGRSPQIFFASMSKALAPVRRVGIEGAGTPRSGRQDSRETNRVQDQTDRRAGRRFGCDCRAASRLCRGSDHNRRNRGRADEDRPHRGQRRELLLRDPRARASRCCSSTAGSARSTCSVRCCRTSRRTARSSASTFTATAAPISATGRSTWSTSATTWPRS